MANLVSYSFHSSIIRTITKDNTPLFCLADVCKVLSLSTPAKVVSQIKDEFELGELNSYTFDTGYGVKNFTMITEPQLYFVMMRSRAKVAREFRQWICNEVLPAIRKTGTYTAQPATACLSYKGKLENKEGDTPKGAEKLLDAPEYVTWYIFEIVDILRGCYVEHSKIEKILDIVKRVKRQGYNLAYARSVDYFNNKVRGYNELKKTYAELLKDYKFLQAQVHYNKSSNNLDVYEQDLKEMTKEMFRQMRSDAEYIASHKDKVARAMARGYLATGMRLLALCDDCSLTR